MERHRETWLVLTRNTEILTKSLRVLHVAPEPQLRRKLSQLGHLDYITGDLLTGDTDMVLDMTNMELASDSVDVVLCSHVLEHIPDDSAAMREVARVLRPSGFALLVVPHDPARSETYEDWSITEPKARERAFGQWDHVRWYSGSDFDARLRSAGLSVERVVGSDDPGERELYGLDGHDVRDWRVLVRPLY